MHLPKTGKDGATMPGIGGELSQDAPPDCDLGVVERRFGIVGCQADGRFLRSVMRTGPWMDDSHGRQQAGALAVLLDHVLGETIYTARPIGHWSLTTELTFDIIVPPPWNTATLHATSWVPRAETTGGFAQCEVVDDFGTLIAVSAAWTQYVPAGDSRVAAERAVPPDDPPPETVNFAEHLGVRISADEQRTRVELPDPERWNNGYGVLHGGVWASLAEVAAAEAFERGGDLRTAHVHVSYLRPPAPGAAISMIVQPMHIGRSFGVIQVTGSDDSGRSCVSATVTGRRRTA
ncbi:PaaI family thioesterase [Streptosporangium sp. NPDC005286]|uniref:PaaI family thioesterase n=1 Tax=Streptosporangium sp. NPDC005286 TaxID=3154463 RepID=UPI0033B652B1